MNFKIIALIISLFLAETFTASSIHSRVKMRSKNRRKEDLKEVTQGKMEEDSTEFNMTRNESEPITDLVEGKENDHVDRESQTFNLTSDNKNKISNLITKQRQALYKHETEEAPHPTKSQPILTNLGTYPSLSSKIHSKTRHPVMKTKMTLKNGSNEMKSRVGDSSIEDARGKSSDKTKGQTILTNLGDPPSLHPKNNSEARHPVVVAMKPRVKDKQVPVDFSTEDSEVKLRGSNDKAKGHPSRPSKNYSKTRHPVMKAKTGLKKGNNKVKSRTEEKKTRGNSIEDNKEKSRESGDKAKGQTILTNLGDHPPPSPNNNSKAFHPLDVIMKSRVEEEEAPSNSSTEHSKGKSLGSSNKVKGKKEIYSKENILAALKSELRNKLNDEKSFDIDLKGISREKQDITEGITEKSSDGMNLQRKYKWNNIQNKTNSLNLHLNNFTKTENYNISDVEVQHKGKEIKTLGKYSKVQIQSKESKSDERPASETLKSKQKTNSINNFQSIKNISDSEESESNEDQDEKDLENIKNELKIVAAKLQEKQENAQISHQNKKRRGHDPKTNYSKAVVGVSVTLIASTILLTVVGIHFRKISFEKRRYYGHSLISTEEEMSLFNREAYHDGGIDRYDSWNSADQIEDPYS